MAVWDIFRLRSLARSASARLSLAIALLAIPTAAAAQGQSERFRFEPWAGALWDAYRNDGGDGNPAWLGAARFGYELGGGPVSYRRWRIIAEIARAEAAEAGTATFEDSLVVGFRNEWWLTTGGVEWDLIGGWMGVTLEAQAGAAWLEREIVAGDTIPPGTPGTTDRAEPTALPSGIIGISAFRHLSHRVQLRLRVEDVITDVFEEPEHSVAVGLGLRFVFE